MVASIASTRLRTAALTILLATAPAALAISYPAAASARANRNAA